MNVKELRRALAGCPDDFTAVLIDPETNSPERIGKLTVCLEGQTVLFEAPAKMDDYVEKPDE